MQKTDILFTAREQPLDQNLRYLAKDRYLIYCNKTTIWVKTEGILQQTDILFTAREQPLGSKLEVSCNRPTSYLLRENKH